MRLKLDENLGRRWAQRLRDAGHDVDTVHDEDLVGAFDAVVLDAASATSRVLVTCDVDFAHPFRFPPASTPGIAVLRVSDRPGAAELQAVVERLCAALDVADPSGHLWIVDTTRIRQYEPPADD